ncbi:MAG: class I SAM-dependent methyltransferase [Gemmatimonadetes bacterium]|nr:class I SAM-dependent methyltransferase [Gemmatimonadota bacterium]
MTTKLTSIVSNELVQDPSSVWVLGGHGGFWYSEGAAAERYLERVLTGAVDLGSSSSELASHIKDWPSEYHLSPKRAQLLSGFAFDRSAKVLEVGCGCGAITRFLGETFDGVVAVEGSLPRARLARLRTRDLEGVSIIAAPFQAINFTRRFDVIVCVGVYEYAASFVEGADPYDAVLRYFSDLLTPDGVVILAIENQFGLKYFASSREDHLGVMFEGLEGYHADRGKARTFGRTELETNLTRHFPAVQFYYPYPDYKLPDCVLAEEFLSQGHAGELVSQMKSRDYAGETPSLWDEASTALELSRNRMLPFFANSFLVVAGKGELRHAAFDQLAVLFSTERAERFRTRTSVVRRADGEIVASKRKQNDRAPAVPGPLTLVEGESPWMDSHSLHTRVYLNAKSRTATLAEVFEPCREWVRYLEGLSTSRAGVKYLGGEHLDCTWSNVYPGAEGITVIDQEWVWNADIPLNVLVIKAIYDFLSRVDRVSGLSAALNARSGKRLIRAIANTLGVDPGEPDFDAFVELESALQSSAFGRDRKREASILRWFLLHRPSLSFVRRQRGRFRRLGSRLRARLGGPE